MSRLMLTLLALLTASCASSTPPPVMSCPAPPAAFLQPLPDLLLVPDGAQLSDVAAVVAANYTRHHETRAQCEALQAWAATRN